MTAPTIVDTTPEVDPDAATGDRPDGTAPIKLVLAVEGIDTSDGRHIEPGALDTRPFPLTIYAQVRSTHGADGDAATFAVGSLTEAERVPGPSIIQRSTGQPFPAGSYAWIGKGWMYTDVPTPESGSKPAYTLMRDRVLYGNSVDLTGVDAEFQYDDGYSDGPPDHIRIHKATIGSTTLVGIPAFMDAFAEVDGQIIEAPQEALALAASAAGRALLSFTSAELGDQCAPCTATHPWLDDFAVSTAKRKAATKAGHALPDGSYPIESKADLDNAIKAVGRAGGPAGTEADRNRVRRHIIKQAKRLNLQDMIPDTWNADGTLKPNANTTTTEPFADTGFVDDLYGDDIEPAALDFSTSGMIALIPASPEQLAVDGGDDPAELHMTLAYLGDQVTAWAPEEIAALHKIARQATDPDYWCQTLQEDAAERGETGPDCSQLYQPPWHEGPLWANVFAHAIFNPNGTPDGQSPATVYLFDGTHQAAYLPALQSDICQALIRELGEVRIPDQYDPWVPHVTAGYNLPAENLTYTGRTSFDRLRVAVGNQRTDYPLGGGQPIVASNAPLPPLEHFTNPNLTEPTGHTVTDDGRVYGHLATWDTCHTGFSGRCVTPPRSTSDYSYFTVHTTRVIDQHGNTVTIPVGYGTISRNADTGGHAGLHMTATEAVKHYDNTGLVVMEFAVGEDDHGIWYSGHLLPGLTEREEHLARGAAFSGDWRPIRGNRELVAALGVVGPGFPIRRARVASGAPLALVASAGLAPAERTPPATGVHPDDRADFAEVMDWVRTQKFTAQQAEHAAALREVLGDGPTLAEMHAEAETDFLLAAYGDHPWFTESLTEDDTDTLAGKPNWVTKAGGLPPYIKRIAKHLQAKGMAQSRAIATAVNAAKKMCSTGDLNWPGLQKVNPGSKGEACAAVADWEKKKANH